MMMMMMMIFYYVVRSMPELRHIWISIPPDDYSLYHHESSNRFVDGLPFNYPTNNEKNISNNNNTSSINSTPRQSFSCFKSKSIEFKSTRRNSNWCGQSVSDQTIQLVLISIDIKQDLSSSELDSVILKNNELIQHLLVKDKLLEVYIVT